MNEKKLRVSNLGASIQKSDVFDGINFEVSAGEVVGLLGHNGCGKSTMLRLLANFERPMRGEVVLNEKKLDINTHTREVIMIPDSIKLISGMTILENFKIIAGQYKHDKESFDKYLKALRLEESQFVGDLSKGNQEIVQMLIYFSIDTDVYLLDEPFSAVDIYRREFIQKIVIDVMLRNEKAIIIITTHLIDEVEGILERVLYLNDGKIEIDKAVEDILSESDSLKSYLKEYYKEEVGFDEFI